MQQNRQDEEQAVITKIFEDPEKVIADFCEKFEERTDEPFHDWLQPLRGEGVEEFTDIKWTAVQMLLHWSNEADEPFDVCARRFMRQFLAEIKFLESQGMTRGLRTREVTGSLIPGENWRFHLDELRPFEKEEKL